jgi:hypothetical protein
MGELGFTQLSSIIDSWFIHSKLSAVGPFVWRNLYQSFCLSHQFNLLLFMGIVNRPYVLSKMDLHTQWNVWYNIDKCNLPIYLLLPFSGTSLSRLDPSSYLWAWRIVLCYQYISFPVSPTYYLWLLRLFVTLRVICEQLWCIEFRPISTCTKHPRSR